MAETEDYDKSATPTAHASTHEDGGSDEIGVDGLAGELVDNQPSTWTMVSGKPTSFTPAAHKTSHQDGGTDEISVTGLAGTLADPQTPAAHKTSHQDGGTDEISVEGLTGELTAEQKSAWTKVSGKPTTFDPSTHKTSHQDGGSDEISVQGLAGALADAQTPAAHKTSHQDGGTDEISVTGLAGLLADAQTPLISFFQKARAYRAAAQNGINGWTKVLLDTDSYDPSNITDLANSRIIPTRAGYYVVLGEVAITVAAGMIGGFYFNGVLCTLGGYTASQYSNNVVDIIYFNGSTDYVELYLYIDATRNLDVRTSTNYLTMVGPF